MDTLDLQKDGLENPEAPMNNTSSVADSQLVASELQNASATENEIEPISQLQNHDENVEELEVEPDLGENFIDERHEVEITHETDEIDLDETSDTHSDYANFSKDQLIAELDTLVSGNEINKIRNTVELLKIWFYKKHKSEVSLAKKSFVEQGGNPDDFKPEEDNDEIRFKELYKKYKELKSTSDQQIEQAKQENLKVKYQIIEELKDLINRNEAFEITFQEFRELQKRWRETGLVPQNDLKNLWDTYHYHVEKFYDFIKLNKELRDLDLKKNLEIKFELCEKAEQLIIEPNVTKAFKNLQEYHNQWRETGPVPSDKKEELWDRFKEATAKINKKHQDYYESLKNEQNTNLQAKTALCEKVEEILSIDIQKPKKWEEKTKELVEIQKLWKTIGFAPKKDNNKIYQRFKEACDAFFARKRSYYEQVKGDQTNNLQIKLDLCVQAESLSESTEWKKTTEDYINLQKRWKEVGPVPRKHSDELWKRFRAACDVFFNRKNSHFASLDSQQEENLKLKLELIEEVEKFIPESDQRLTINKLADFQKRWAEIGHVPIKKKDEVQIRFRAAIKKQFDTLKLDDNHRNLVSFKSKMEEMSDTNRNKNKINLERTKIYNKIREMENEIALYENNIGFFSKSNNADALIRDVRNKIERAKEQIEILKEKLKIVDDIDQE